MRGRQRTVVEHGPHPIDIYVGRRLREARLLAGLNQEQLGDALGVSFQAVQKYESGANRLSASRLLLAAKALGRPTSYFFHDVQGDVPAQEERLSRDEVEMIRHYRHVDEGMRMALMKFVAALSTARPK
jgi:transcriptional regulator with XRE-family HTH domain